MVSLRDQHQTQAQAFFEELKFNAPTNDIDFVLFC